MTKDTNSAEEIARMRAIAERLRVAFVAAIEADPPDSVTDLLGGLAICVAGFLEVSMPHVSVRVPQAAKRDTAHIVFVSLLEAFREGGGNERDPS